MRKEQKRIILFDQDILFHEKIIQVISTLKEAIDFETQNNKTPSLETLSTNTIVLIPIAQNKDNHIIHELKSHCPKIKIIAVLSNLNNDINPTANIFDFDSYISRMDSATTISKTIEKVFNNGFYYQSYILKSFKDLNNSSTENKLSSFFTKREFEVLKLICEQKTTQEISEQLFLSPRTIEGYRNNMMIKTNSKNVAGLIVYSFQNKLW
jgi:DNA-binding NarL/FixJ family response regulator